MWYIRDLTIKIHKKKQHMRPKPILYFEILFVGLALMMLFRVWFQWFATYPNTPLLYHVIVNAMILLMAGLTLMVSRRRNRFAMWALIALLAIGLAIPLTVFAFTGGGLDLTNLLVAIPIVAASTGIGLLFLPSSRRWMADKKKIANLSDRFS